LPFQFRAEQTKTARPIWTAGFRLPLFQLTHGIADSIARILSCLFEKFATNDHSLALEPLRCAKRELSGRFAKFPRRPQGGGYSNSPLAILPLPSSRLLKRFRYENAHR